MGKVKIAVLAGTPTDTAIGVELVNGYGYEALGAPTSQSGPEQDELQKKDPAKLLQVTLGLIREKADEGAEAALIYCNSLSVAVDVDELKKQAPIPVVTPLDAHAEIAKKYRHVGVLAATAKSVAGLEMVYYDIGMDDENFDNRFQGCSALPLVMGIERHEPPLGLIEGRGVLGLCEGMIGYGAECIVLGCTHFPYIAKELAEHISVPVINPDDIMMDMIKELAG
ncbi:MAG: aspartate/glutamate racemase family protein [Clostridiales Family XIII bacterium]|jgi:glutamate racemase|nr:aspartate/glutamate racemase family protein [Clostridiales Family XIII bacterium]